VPGTPTIAEYLKEQSCTEIARNLFAEGTDESLIQKVTKLSKKVLADLKKEAKHR